MPGKSTTKQFVDKADIVHNRFYDYSKVKYEHSTTPVCIVCPIHGEFWQRPNNHLSGYGCRSCGKTKLSNRRKYSKLDFIKSVEGVHNCWYDYSKVVYVDSKTEVIITCPLHGDFWMTPTQHQQGGGCRKCILTSYTKRLNSEKLSALGDINLPPGVKAVPLNNKDYVIVSEEDYGRVMEHTWVKSSSGSAMSAGVGEIHRFIMNAPKGLVVDHINGNRNDNRRENLRICTPKENSYNRSKSISKTSKYKGVYFRKDVGKWASSIRYEGVLHNLGLYHEEIDAAKAYDTAAKKFFKEFAKLNFQK